MIVKCASCGAANRIPDSPRKGSAYRCGSCSQALRIVYDVDDRDRYYEILELKPGASREEVRRAYTDLVKVWHPDRFTHDPRLQQKAQEKLKEINEAYERLQAGSRMRALQPGNWSTQSQSGRESRESRSPESQDPPSPSPDESSRRPEKEQPEEPSGQPPPPSRTRISAKRKILIGSLSALVIVPMILIFAGPGRRSEKEKEEVPSDEKPLAEGVAAKCNSFYSTKNYARALSCFQEAGEKNPDDTTIWILVASCNEKLGRYAEAVQAYQQVIRLTPDDSVAHHNLGLLYTELKQDSEAIEEFRKAIDLKSDYVEAYHGLGAVYSRQERFQEAVQAYEQAVRLKPDDADLSYSLGWTYVRMGNSAAASKQYEALRKLDKRKAQQLSELIFPEMNVQPHTKETKSAAPGTEMATQSEKARTLKAPVPPKPPSGYFTIGSTKDEVIAVQGTPDKFSETTFRYGSSRVGFQNGRVVSWKNKVPALKAKLIPAPQTTAKPYFTVGSTKDEVIAVQGTPDEFSEDMFRYGSSRVDFQHDRVVSWKNKVPALKVQLRPEQQGQTVVGHAP